MTAELVATHTADALLTLGLASWLGTMSPHAARAYQVDLRQFTGWLAAQPISPDRVTPGVVTGWLSQLEAAGRSVATRRRKLAAVLSFYRYAAAEGLAFTPPVPHQLPKLHRDDADTGALDTAQARRLWEATAGQPRTRALVAPALRRGRRSPLQRFRCCRRMAGAEGRPCSLCRCGPAAWGFSARRAPQALVGRLLPKRQGALLRRLRGAVADLERDRVTMLGGTPDRTVGVLHSDAGRRPAPRDAGGGTSCWRWRARESSSCWSECWEPGGRRKGPAVEAFENCAASDNWWQDDGGLMHNTPQYREPIHA